MNENLSYICGLLCADGFTIRYQKKDGGITYRTRIELSDAQIIQDIANYLNIKVYYRKRYILKEREFYSITIPKHLLMDFKECFCKERVGVYNLYKSSVIKNDFIRGYFDGDGSVSEHPNSKNLLRIGFSVNSHHVEILSIVEDFINLLNLHASYYLDKRGIGSWYISINKKSEVRDLYTYIYNSNTNLYLHRKYNIFLAHGFPNLVMN